MVQDYDFHFSRAGCTTLEALQAGTMEVPAAALLLEDRAFEDVLRPLAAQYGPRLLLPEVWQAVFPQCGVLISSALSGGTFLQRLQEAPRGRSWLLQEPFSMEFPLPCPTGAGQPVPVPETAGFFSQALCCQYAHFLRDNRGVMLLWDTEETLARKRALAQAQGFCGYVTVS